MNGDIIIMLTSTKQPWMLTFHPAPDCTNLYFECVVLSQPRFKGAFHTTLGDISTSTVRIVKESVNQVYSFCFSVLSPAMTQAYAVSPCVVKASSRVQAMLVCSCVAPVYTSTTTSLTTAHWPKQVGHMLKIPGSLLDVTHTDIVVLFLVPYTLIFMIGIVKDIADYASYHWQFSFLLCCVS